MSQRRCFLLAMLIEIPFAWVIAILPTHAQVISDGTLSTTVTSSDRLNFVIEGGEVCCTQAGQRAGPNLFHSFDEFSVPTHGSAIFNNAPHIDTIFSRVTGTSRSAIDGLIQTNGAANLFLLNPNGIVFGPNAQLNVGGSFLGSTANSLKFEDGFEFSATDPTQSPLLSITAPIGLQYGVDPGPIIVQARREDSAVVSGLSVPPAHTLGLIGGTVKIDGGVLQGTGGRLEIGSVGANSSGVELSPMTNRYDQYEVIYDDTDSFATVRLSNGALVSSQAGGDIQVRGDRIRLSRDSTIVTTNTDVVGGNIDLNAQRRIIVDTGAKLYTITEGIANGGNITLNASRSLDLSGVGYDEFLQNLLILALSGTADISAMPAHITTLTTGEGEGGTITASTASFAMSEGMRLSSFATGAGSAQPMTINASSNLTLDQSTISSNADSLATGNGGDIKITTPSLLVTNGSINSSALGSGTGGDVTIQSDTIEVLDTRSILPPVGLLALTTIGTTVLGVGDAGDTIINTQTLLIQGGATIASASLGQINPDAGIGGNIVVNATDGITLEGVSVVEGIESGIATTSSSKSPAGNIELFTGHLTLRNGAAIQSDAYGTAPGGNVDIVATEGIEVTGFSQYIASGTVVPSRISSAARLSNIELGLLIPVIGDTSLPSTGDAGEVRLTTPNISVNNGGRITVSSETPGAAGDLLIQANRILLHQDGAITGATSGGDGGHLVINAQDFITLKNQSAITSSADALATGSSGDIQIQAGSLHLTDATIEANNLEVGGRGGSIDIATQQPLTLNRSSITATTASGDGGDLIFRIGSLLLLEGNSLFSTTAGQDNNNEDGRNGGGNGGNIDIRTPLLIAPAKENNDITANAFTGNGGNITISTQGLFGLNFRDRLTSANDITASSEFGINGTVEINNPEADPNSQVLELPEALVDISLLVRPGCSLDEEQFVLAGRGGLPDSPMELMNGDRPWFDLRDLSAFLSNTSDTLASNPIVQPVEFALPQEATGMKSTPNGTIQLVVSHFHNRILPFASCTSQTNFL